MAANCRPCPRPWCCPVPHLLHRWASIADWEGGVQGAGVGWEWGVQADVSRSVTILDTAPSSCDSARLLAPLARVGNSSTLPRRRSPLATSPATPVTPPSRRHGGQYHRFRPGSHGRAPDVPAAGRTLALRDPFGGRTAPAWAACSRSLEQLLLREAMNIAELLGQHAPHRMTGKIRWSPGRGALGWIGGITNAPTQPSQASRARDESLQRHDLAAADAHTVDGIEAGGGH